MIRSILFNFIFWPIFILYLALFYPIIYFSSEKTTLRLGYIPVTKWLFFCLKHFAKIDYKVLNKEKIPEGQIIIGCNHQSAWETFVFSLLFDNLVSVVKKELLKKPIAGIYMKRLKCIPVDRESPVKAIKTLIKYSKIAYDDGKSILIFPNGTRSSDEEHTEYKSGIYAIYRSLGIPVVPAHVNSGKYWPRNSFKKNPGTIILDFKEPIYPGLSKEEFFKEFEESLKL